MSSSTASFRVAFTGDFLDPAGQPRYRDYGLPTFANQPHVSHRLFSDHSPEVTTRQIGDAHGVVVLTPRVTRASVSQSPELLAIARFGVGYDTVDVEACTDHDVLVLIAVGAVDRSVAEATLTWMLSLSHHVRAKDRLVRTGDWNGRSQFMGTELRRRTLGLVGFGRIARALVPLVAPFGMREIVAYDPHVDRQLAEQLGVRLVSLNELLAASDFVSIHCPLAESTRNLIGGEQLARMKPGAYLINTSRGGIVDEGALCQSLRERRIAGAALDVFETEPLILPHPLTELDNVLLAPHSIAWTEELFSEIGRTVCEALVDLSHGKEPTGVVNPEVLDRPGFRQKWSRWRANAGERRA
ncbi:MAG TPA: phosphoglycerate dehydrogenase [Planctomycetaceae bacterium]|nr:phosphoglycerate dehydrogenase [Planctomycetaceae bacterium]